MSNVIADSPADIVQAVLVQLGLATLGGTWPVYATEEPDLPDNCITTFNTTGIDKGRDAFGQLYCYFGIQVRIRGATDPGAWLKADAIRRGMAENVNKMQVSVDSLRPYLVYCFSNIGPVLSLGTDPNSERRLYTINATLTVRQL